MSKQHLGFSSTVSNEPTLNFTPNPENDVIVCDRYWLTAQLEILGRKVSVLVDDLTDEVVSLVMDHYKNYEFTICIDKGAWRFQV